MTLSTIISSRRLTSGVRSTEPGGGLAANTRHDLPFIRLLWRLKLAILSIRWQLLAARPQTEVCSARELPAFQSLYLAFYSPSRLRFTLLSVTSTTPPRVTLTIHNASSPNRSHSHQTSHTCSRHQSNLANRHQSPGCIPAESSLPLARPVASPLAQSALPTNRSTSKRASAACPQLQRMYSARSHLSIPLTSTFLLIPSLPSARLSLTPLRLQSLELRP